MREETPSIKRSFLSIVRVLETLGNGELRVTEMRIGEVRVREVMKYWSLGIEA
jgi:hypothetical protein